MIPQRYKEVGSGCKRSEIFGRKPKTYIPKKISALLISTFFKPASFFII